MMHEGVCFRCVRPDRRAGAPSILRALRKCGPRPSSLGEFSSRRTNDLLTARDPVATICPMIV